jgi:hypothetical protein
MDFSYRSAPPDMDDSIINFFRDFKNKALAGKTKTKIILPAEFSEDSLLQLSFIDKINQGNPNIFLGSPVIATENSDRSIRYVIDFKVTSDKDTIWNIPMIAYCIDSISANGKLNSEIVEKAGLHIENQIENQNFSLNIYLSRILYAMKPPMSYSNNDFQLPGNMDKGNKQGIDLRFSPHELTGINSPDDFLSTTQKNTLLNGKIVIVGNSSQQKGDIYLTPIGEMAGFYIIGNALNTLFIHQVNHLSFFLILMIELFTIIIAAYLFLHLHSLLAEFLCLIIMGVPLYFLTINIFSTYGTLLNVIFILLGIAIHRFEHGIEELITSKGHKHNQHNKSIEEN